MGLAEETGGGIPRAVGAMAEPDPVGIEAQENPNGAAKGASEVGDGGIDGDDQVEFGDEGGSIGEGGALVQGGDVEVGELRQDGGIARAKVLLERDESGAGDLQDTLKD